MASSALNRPTQGFEIFKDYEDGKYIYRDQLHALICHLCGNINAPWNPNRSYYNDWHDESNNLQIVIRWRERNDLLPIGKYGERICFKQSRDEGELIDLTKPEFKDHCKVCLRCNKLEAVKLR